MPHLHSCCFEKPWTRDSVYGLLESGDDDAIGSFLRAVNAFEPMLQKLKQFHAYMPDLDRENVEKIIALADGKAEAEQISPSLGDGRQTFPADSANVLDLGGPSPCFLQ